MAETKYIFVTGGVASSLGKGIISSSIGKLLQARGYNVTIQKFDPYINIDPGTLNPYEHGECYVTVDGHEADLDLGHYERFLGIQTTKANNITTGRIYKSVIDKERRGDYLGKTIQIIPHITDEIKRNVKLLGNKNKFDFVITEIGGTVGDIESLPYLESIRQLKWELGKNALCVHLTYVPYLAAAGELKTKPTQHSVKELQSVGIQPDILVLRTEHELSAGLRKKVALFCNVDESAVIQSKDMPSIYEVPLRMQEQGLDKTILEKMGLPVGETPTLGPWRDFLNRRNNATEKVKIGLVGKYDLQDAYKSIHEALSHAATYNDRKAEIHFINSEKLTDENVAEAIKDKGYDQSKETSYGGYFVGEYLERYLITADCAEPKSIADMQSEGLRCVPCHKEPGCVAYRVKWLQHRRLVIDPKRTPEAYREFVNYSYATDKMGISCQSCRTRIII